MSGSTSEPTHYHSSFSAEEVQNTLLSVQNKVDKGNVLADFPTDPADLTDEHIASAKLLQAELQKITEFHEGGGLANAVANITNNNLFTDDLKAKLDKLGGNARGAFADAAHRDTVLDDESALSQGDFILLISDAGGYPSIQYWDITATTWVDAYKSTGTTSTTIPAVGSSEVAVFGRTSARLARYTVSAIRGTTTQMWDVAVAHDGPGDNIYVSTEREFKAPSSATRLATFTASKSPDGSLIALIATTTETNVTINIQRTAIL